MMTHSFPPSDSPSTQQIYDAFVDYSLGTNVWLSLVADGEHLQIDRSLRLGSHPIALVHAEAEAAQRKLLWGDKPVRAVDAPQAVAEEVRRIEQRSPFHTIRHVYKLAPVLSRDELPGRARLAIELLLIDEEVSTLRNAELRAPLSRRRALELLRKRESNPTRLTAIAVLDSLARIQL